MLSLIHIFLHSCEPASLSPALEMAQARERHEQLKRRTEARALLQARRRLDFNAMQDEAALQEREDEVNNRLIFD